MTQTAGLSRVLDEDERLLERKRFFGEIIGAELGRAHRRFDRSMAGDHDDLGRIVEQTNLFEHFETVDSGQPDIKQNYVEARLSELLEAILAPWATAGLLVFFLKNALQRFADTGFVVDDEDVSHASWPPER